MLCCLVLCCAVLCCAVLCCAVPAGTAGISVCAGGIIGLGEGEEDRVGLLLQLATLPEHPESVPINRLVAVKGTPLQVSGAVLLGTGVVYHKHCPSSGWWQ
jgi:hypothetical protein